jgi:hypothetical protein
VLIIALNLVLAVVLVVLAVPVALVAIRELRSSRLAPTPAVAPTLLLKLTRTDTDDRHMVLPAETGPALAPDRLSVWPVEGERYGLDATYHGATGFERAEAQRQHLQAENLPATVRQELGDGWTLRLGPLTHSAAWTAIEAFIGPPAPPRTG